MLRLALASAMTGCMAFAAVAFWPSGEPARTVRMAVIQPASTGETFDPIAEVLDRAPKDESRSASSDLMTEPTAQPDTASPVELASLEDEPGGYDNGPEIDDGSGFDVGAAETEASAAEPEIDTAWVETGEGGTLTSSEMTEASVPRLPVRKPARSAAPTRRTTYTLVERIAEIGPGAVARIEEKFAQAGVSWPPERLAYLAFKDEKVIEVQAQSGDGAWQPVYRYPILRASGDSGPKLKEGDRQVPEGLYRIASLNPNSRYHVSLRVSYPNDFDRAMAKADGRSKLGGDIMIHGKALSIGCLAVGDPASEEFFVMAHSVGLQNLQVVIAPRDFRKPSVFSSMKETINLGGPVWLPRLYEDIKTALAPFPSMPPKVAPSIAQR
ncbi:MAG: hypothetical protein R3D57_02940 [Hyphomicrobiaceae bacterium]